MGFLQERGSGSEARPLCAGVFGLVNRRSSGCLRGGPAESGIGHRVLGSLRQRVLPIALLGSSMSPHGGAMAKTLIRIFLDAVSQHRKPALFMRRLPDAAGGGRWEPISSERARGDVESLALGLAALGLPRGERVALLSENRSGWATTDRATRRQAAS